jgi:hypothetical protein
LKKKSRWSVGVNGNHQKFRPKMGTEEKTDSVSERAEDGLSSHAFISISKILTKTDFFEGEGGLQQDQ